MGLTDRMLERVCDRLLAGLPPRSGTPRSELRRLLRIEEYLLRRRLR